jgi:hypothetical protein
MLEHKSTFILINISSNEDILFLSLIRIEDVINVLKSSINASLLNNYKSLDILIAVFDNYGICQDYKRHIITSGIPINTVIKRIHYSVLLLLKNLNLTLSQ